MDKKILCGVSICAVVLLILGSLTNVVGYQSVKSTVLSDSPLFAVRTKRAINQASGDTLTSEYIGKGKNSILFPLRDNRTVLFQKFIDGIKTMNDNTFNRFVEYVVQLLSQQEKTKDVDAKDIISGLNQIRENSKIFDKYDGIIVNNRNYTWKDTPTLCWFPGCLLLNLLWVIEVIIFIFAVFVSFFYSMKNPTYCLCPPH